MGRHSAPDDGDDTEAVLAAHAAVLAAAGRHVRPGQPEQTQPEQTQPEQTQPAPAALAPHGVAAHTNADLHLLRESPALRARCIAAIVVPFAVFTAALILLGTIGSFLLWMWVPTVLAGMLVGIFLDLAHRRAGTSGAAHPG